MPLVQFIGGVLREDNTQVIRLAPAEDGTERVLNRGGDPVEVSGDELRTLASNYEVKVVESAGTPPLSPPSPPPEPEPVAFTPPPPSTTISSGPTGTAGEGS